MHIRLAFVIREPLNVLTGHPNAALKDDPNYIKALQRRATANEQIASWSSLSAAQEG